jgi:hypothetical protein
MSIKHLGHENFRLNVELPPTLIRDGPPSEAQLSAVREFYGPFDPSSLTGHQCHVLLAVRSYARACLSVILANMKFDRREPIAVMVAAHILASPKAAEDVARWSDRQFRRQPDSPQIMRTKHFWRVSTEVSRLAREFNL